MIKELLSLSGRNALVTGSSQGIGRTIALAFAEFGANVVVHNRQGDEKAREVAERAYPAPDRISQRMNIPLGPPGQPEDIAGMAAFLCSDAGRYITGQTIFVDGGMSL